MKESELLKQVLLAATNLGYRLFRNNVAKGWIGKTEYITHAKTVTVYPGDKIIRQGRRLNSGLCVGSSDLIGFKTVTIDQSLVGSKIAQFTAFETKVNKRKTTPEQDAFLNAINFMGGIGKVVRDTDDLSLL